MHKYNASLFPQIEKKTELKSEADISISLKYQCFTEAGSINIQETKFPHPFTFRTNQ